MNDTAQPGSAPASIKDFLVKEIEDAWTQRREGALLARLGSQISRSPELANAKAELRGRGLLTFIREELGDRVEIVSHPTKDIVKVAIPLAHAEEAKADLLRLFPVADAGKKKAVQSTGVSYAVLVAFTRPLSAGKKRVISFSPAIRFADLDEGAPVPETSKIIDRKFIVEGNLDDENTFQKARANIDEWRNSQALAPTDLSKQRADDAGSTLLASILSALTEADQRRVQLPLDVVAKLLRHPGHR